MAKVQLEAIDKEAANDTHGVPGVQALTRGIQIVDAVAARDADRARAEIRRHLLNGRSRVLSTLER